MTAAPTTLLDPACRPYCPRGATAELFGCRADEVLHSGPARTGKSRGVLEKLNACAMKFPGMRALLTRKTRASMFESVLSPLPPAVLRPVPEQD